jgi:6-pyruvoyltetrahydropterin/6-carboxytetrahydropterin synthase
MYEITKRIEIAGSHQLHLPYESKCNELHGHNWIITVVVHGEKLNSDGMLIDFTHIKNVVNILDHKHINAILPAGMNSTAENMAKWVFDALSQAIVAITPNSKKLSGIHVKSVTVQESEGNTACYTQ